MASCPMCNSRLHIVKYRWLTNVLGLTHPYFICPTCNWRKKIKDVHTQGGINPHFLKGKELKKARSTGQTNQPMIRVFWFWAKWTIIYAISLSIAHWIFIASEIALPPTFLGQILFSLMMALFISALIKLREPLFHKKRYSINKSFFNWVLIRAIALVFWNFFWIPSTAQFLAYKEYLVGGVVLEAASQIYKKVRK